MLPFGHPQGTTTASFSNFIPTLRAFELLTRGIAISVRLSGEVFPLQMLSTLASRHPGIWCEIKKYPRKLTLPWPGMEIQPQENI